MSNELVTIQADNGSPYAIMPVLDVRQAMARRQMLIDYTAALMVKGRDFGRIPGAGDKPTLLKPGAEKLASLFGLSPLFETVESVMDWTGGDHDGEPFFYIRCRCTLTRGEQVVGQGLGSCNSWEKKYRYRNSGKNPNPADLVNTIDKMAQKRALVAAVLIAVNASEFFTQDVEDYSDIVDGEYTTQPQPPRPGTKVPAAKPAAQPATVTDPVTAFVTQAEKRLGVQAVSFATGRLTDWVKYVTGGQFDPARADYLTQVLDRYCSAVADNDNTHTKDAAEKARADYEGGLAALADEVQATEPPAAHDEPLFPLPVVDPA